MENIITVIDDHPQFLHIKVENPKLSHSIYLIPMYASCETTVQKDL